MTDYLCLATVSQVSRRKAIVRTAQGKIYSVPVLAKHTELCVGDVVNLDGEDTDPLIVSINARTNLLRRSYFNKTKSLAANVDRVVVVSAVGALFNTHFIDRALVAAASEGIAVVLVLNKIDLATPEDLRNVERYSKIGVEVHCISVREGQGITAFWTAISKPEIQSVVLCGLSGVGKSSLLNAFVPSAYQRTGDVSERTGQGRQTTSQAIGFWVAREGLPDMLLIDTPGLQNFGLMHLGAQDLIHYFPEIWECGLQCGFRDCQHIKEQSCAVKDAVNLGTVSSSRYESYLHICEEIGRARASFRTN